MHTLFLWKALKAILQTNSKAKEGWENVTDAETCQFDFSISRLCSFDLLCCSGFAFPFPILDYECLCIYLLVDFAWVSSWQFDFSLSYSFLFGSPLLLFFLPFLSSSLIMSLHLSASTISREYLVFQSVQVSICMHSVAAHTESRDCWRETEDDDVEDDVKDDDDDAEDREETRRKEENTRRMEEKTKKTGFSQHCIERLLKKNGWLCWC